MKTNKLIELNDYELKSINGGEEGDALYYLGWAIGAVVGAIGTFISTSGETSGTYVSGHYQL